MTLAVEPESQSEACLSFLFEDDAPKPKRGLSLVATERKTPAKLARKQAKLYQDLHPNVTTIIPDQLEKPYTVTEAAPFWGQSPKATRRHFEKLPGVRRIPSPTRYVKGKKVRKYNVTLIPPSVLRSEIAARTNPAKTN